MSSCVNFALFFVSYTATTEIYTYRHTLSLQAALPFSLPSETGSQPSSTMSAVGPVAAVGLYEMSRRREQGMATSWAHAFGVVRSSEEHTSELQSLMRISYAVFGLKKKIKTLRDLQH